MARYLEPGEGFWASFARSGFAASRAMTDADLSNEREEVTELMRGAAMRGAHAPLAPQLHSVLEAQLSRRLWPLSAAACAMKQADHVVSQQIDRDFLLDHRRRTTAQHVHAQRGLDAGEIQLDVPAAAIERVELGFVNGTGIAQRGDQNAAAEAGLAHQQLFGSGRVLLARHPARARARLAPVHQVIALAQPLAAPKIRVARAVLA